MLTSVYTKAIRDRTIGVLIGAGAVVLTAMGGIAIYADLPDTITKLWEGMPEAFLAIAGIVPSVGITGIVLGEMVSLIAPLVLAGLAISIGTSAIAGEERDGTLGVLLANPRSRTAVLLSKAGALVTLIASLSSAEFIKQNPPWDLVFAIGTPLLAAVLTIVGGFSQTFQWGAAWQDMVMTAQELQKERDRFLVTKSEDRDLQKEVALLNDFVLEESHGFFERMLGRAKPPKGRVGTDST